MGKNSTEAFLSRLDKSRASTFEVAKYLHKQGYTVSVSAFDYRPTDSNWEDHVDSGDIYICKEPGTQHRIDVKQISREFTGRYDFPFPYMFVSDSRAVDRADPFPLAYIVLNAQFTFMGIIWSKTRKHWRLQQVKASNTDKIITVYACPIEYVDFREIDND